jgi:pilus assembly protein Flp/PilA
MPFESPSGQTRESDHSWCAKIWRESRANHYSSAFLRISARPPIGVNRTEGVWPNRQFAAGMIAPADSNGPTSLFQVAPILHRMVVYAKTLSTKTLVGKAVRKSIVRVRRFAQSDEGPTAVEYAVMLALIVIVCLTAIKSVGTKANTVFSNAAS